jgi:hypothetical protein
VAIERPAIDAKFVGQILTRGRRPQLIQASSFDPAIEGIESRRVEDLRMHRRLVVSSERAFARVRTNRAVLGGKKGQTAQHCQLGVRSGRARNHRYAIFTGSLGEGRCGWRIDLVSDCERWVVRAGDGQQNPT